MMTNLFSCFDPCSSMNFSMNWVSTCLFMLFLPLSYWLPSSRSSTLYKNILMNIHKEITLLLNNQSYNSLLFISMFLFILTNNTLGLIPYVFTSSSHLVFALSLALPMWVTLMLFGWIKKSQMMLAHLIPGGTPPILMPFMVCIETISNLIRPGSLAVRLTANMIAGHLLMSLLGNNVLNMSTIAIWLIVFLQMILLLFESAVAVIQSYVFTILSSLYTKEVAYV